jgi:hypothetical protein
MVTWKEVKQDMARPVSLMRIVGLRKTIAALIMPLMAIVILICSISIGLLSGLDNALTSISGLAKRLWNGT